MVDRDTEEWAARTTMAMHNANRDGPSRGCKTCPGDRDPDNCPNVRWAKGILALERAAAQVPHPKT